MEPQILLAQLRAHLEREPDWDQYSPTSREHLEWLSQGYALVARWDRLEAMSFKMASDFLSAKITRDSNLGKLLGILHRAIASIEIDVTKEAEVSFGAGEVYDFFNALNKVVSSAEKSLFIIDPYLDHTVFDHYLNSREEKVTVRLLLNKGAENILPAAQKYIDQFGDVLEVKKSKEIHDRVIFVDGYVCWLLGQSVKDAAKAKPTYLVQLPPDVVSTKLDSYEDIWRRANSL